MVSDDIAGQCRGRRALNRVHRRPARRRSCRRRLLQEWIGNQSPAGTKAAGYRPWYFPEGDLAAGSYFIKLETNGHTINKTVQIIEQYLSDDFDEIVLKKDNGASKLANILINECTHLDMIIGNAINPAHQNPYFPDELSIKWKSTHALAKAVEKLGKEVTFIKY